MASIHRFGFSRSQNDLSKIFKALGHPTRLAIIDHLLADEKVMCKELAQNIGFSAPTITGHIQILMESGILGYEKVANITYYAVNPLLIIRANEALNGIVTSTENQSIDFKRMVFSQQPLPDSF